MRPTRSFNLAQLHFKPQSAEAPALEAQRLDVQHVICRMPPHTHHYLEFIYFESAGGRHRVGHHDREVQPGDLFTIAPGELHDASGLRGAQGWIVLFTPTALNSHDAELQNYFAWLRHPLLLPFTRPVGFDHCLMHVPPPARAPFESLLGSLARELDERHFAYQRASSSLLQLLLVDIARWLDPRSHTTLVDIPPLVRLVLDTIDRRYAETLKIANLAHELHRSPNHLNAVVRQATGRTISEWVRERRMAEARRLLLQGSAVTSVGQQVGYPDTTHFIRQFKRLHGITPLAWQKGQP